MNKDSNSEHDSGENFNEQLHPDNLQFLLDLDRQAAEQLHGPVVEEKPQNTNEADMYDTAILEVIGTGNKIQVLELVLQVMRKGLSQVAEQSDMNGEPTPAALIALEMQEAAEEALNALSRQDSAAAEEALNKVRTMLPVFMNHMRGH